MNPLALDTIYARRPALNYICPAICEAVFSSSSFPSLILDAVDPRNRNRVSGVVVTYTGGGDYLINFNNYPGALCYSVYKLNDANDPFSGYTIIAECITDPVFDPEDWFFPPLPPGTPVCLSFTALTPDGETELSDPTCVFFPPNPGEPPPTGGGCILNGATLPDGLVGVDYSVTLLPNGPADIPQWTVYGGALPSGLSLNINTGVISGTPEVAGTFNFNVVLSKNGGGSCWKAFQITISGDCIADDPTLPDAQVDAVYEYCFNTEFAVENPIWTLASGALPDGLVLDPGGCTGGTPTESGDFAFTVALYDGEELLCTKDFTLHVDDSCFLDNAALPDAFVGEFYVYDFTPDPSIVTPNYEFVSGTLPDGLAHNGFGTIFGNVGETLGTFTFTMRLLDDVTPVCEKEFTITVVESCIAGSATLPNGDEDVAYSYQFEAVDTDLPNLTWALEFFSEVPVGMTLHANGLLDGTPTVSGGYFFVVGMYSDGELVCRKNITLTINEPPPDCPDFATEITWGTPTEFVEGNGTLSWTPDAGAGNTFECIATGSNPTITPIASSTGNNTGTMSYNGNGCNCKVTVIKNSNADSFSSGFITITSDISGSLLVANWEDEGPGTYEYSFQLPDTMGATHVITFFVQGSGIADSVTGSSYSVDFSGTITTA